MINKSFRTDDCVDEILRKYSKTVYRIAYLRTKNQADADDILQEVFMRFIKCSTQFKDEEHVKAWLIRAAVNCSKNLMNSAWYRRTAALQDNIICQFDKTDSLYLTVLELPKKYRTIIHLHYYEDMSIADISKTMHMKESTVKSQLFRARNMLRELLKGDYEDV